MSAGPCGIVAALGAGGLASLATRRVGLRWVAGGVVAGAAWLACRSLAGDDEATVRPLSVHRDDDPAVECYAAACDLEGPGFRTFEDCYAVQCGPVACNPGLCGGASGAGWRIFDPDYRLGGTVQSRS